MRRVLLIFVLLVAACGGGGGDDDDSESSGGGLDGARVEVAAVWSGDEQKRFSAVLDRFAKGSGARVRFTSTGDDIATVLGTRLEGGKPPDVAILPQPGLLVTLARRDALQPLPEKAVALIDRHYDDVWKGLGTVDGRPLGVWFKATNKSTFWYNRPLLDDAGVKPPATWDDLLAAAQQVSDSGVAPFSVGGADGWTLTDWFENVYLRGAGPEAYDRLARHEIPWTDGSVTQALELLRGVFGKDDWIAGGRAGALQTGFTDSVAGVFADPPKAAMVYEGDFVAGVVSGETTAKLGVDADFFDFPSVGSSPRTAVVGGDVAVLLRNSPGGRALIEFLATPDAAKEWARRGGFISPNRGLNPSVYATDVERRAAEALLAAEVVRFDLSDLQPADFGATPGKGLWKLFQDYLSDPSAVEPVTRQMEEAAASAYAG